MESDLWTTVLPTRLYLHPTRHEALTLFQSLTGPSLLTRWSLSTSPATPLRERTLPPEWTPTYVNQNQQWYCSGGLTEPLFDGTFALVLPDSDTTKSLLELCHWHDLSRASPLAFPTEVWGACNPVCSPNGRWVITSYNDGLRLFDRLSGEILGSSQTDRRCSLIALACDATSRFVAGILQADVKSQLTLWQIDPIGHLTSPLAKGGNYDDSSLDQVKADAVISPFHSNLARSLYELDDDFSYGDYIGSVAFSPDSRMVVFSLTNISHYFVVAYEVLSGKQLWLINQETDYPSPFIFVAGGKALLLTNTKGEILVYRCSDGSLLSRVSSGLSAPIEALALDHDRTSLWLATQKTLIRYPLPVDLHE